MYVMYIHLILYARINYKCHIQIREIYINIIKLQTEKNNNNATSSMNFVEWHYTYVVKKMINVNFN